MICFIAIWWISQPICALFMSLRANRSNSFPNLLFYQAHIQPICQWERINLIFFSIWIRKVILGLEHRKRKVKILVLFLSPAKKRCVPDRCVHRTIIFKYWEFYYITHPCSIHVQSLKFRMQTNHGPRILSLCLTGHNVNSWVLMGSDCHVKWI